MTSIEPAVGPVSGGSTVTIHGAGFKDQNIRVFFTDCESLITLGQKNALGEEVAGVYVSETTLTCKTPIFTLFEPCKVEVKLMIGNGDLTNTSAPFLY